MNYLASPKIFFVFWFCLHFYPRYLLLYLEMCYLLCNYDMLSQCIMSFKFFYIICLVKDALPTHHHHFIGFRKFTTKLRKLRREPVHVVSLCENYFIFVQKYVAFYKITRETGSARGKPVQHGKPVRAVLVHIMKTST